jgi:site-specific recombinase XerD
VTTLSDGLAAYRICAQAEGKSQRTIDWIADAVGYFNEFLGNPDLETITVDNLRGFIIALQRKRAFSNHRLTKPQNRTLSPESVASYARAIKTFFSFLEREELINNNPVRKVKLPKTPKKNMPVFSEKELQRLLAQPDKKSNEGYRDYVVMLTLLDTGIRVSELCNLKVSDVDLSNGYLRVMGKGAKERYVPIGAKLTKALLKYQLMHRPEGCDNFFITRDGHSLVKKRVQDFIKSYGEKAGIRTRCSPHTFRSSSAVLYLRNGGDPFTLQKKLGHSSLTMTRRYSVLADSDVKAQHLKYGVVDKLGV